MLLTEVGLSKSDHVLSRLNVVYHSWIEVYHVKIHICCAHEPFGNILRDFFDALHHLFEGLIVIAPD